MSKTPVVRFNYNEPIHVLGVSKYISTLGLYSLDACVYADLNGIKERVAAYFAAYPRHKVLVRMEQFKHEEDPDGKGRAFKMIVGSGKAPKLKAKPTTKQGRATSKRMKMLTKEAKHLRTEKPNMTWANAMKRAAKNLKKK
ncbi:hypothetical protein FAES_2277 [Fibrella aestuarina BUZ 2]|uniref:Uncharacterized protein n=1 Tax=Fibrella aestuarina BUZ 2 TaxID=1166018 RepID=I0K833_9BACT|nr:hypothetical protein [Fibrella aestuarina]CCH00286.1 hypothetical protein FAES_2277 [Fibrella aestuarina BUZ 2]